MAEALALWLAFNLPAYHLVWLQDGHVATSIEDMTLPECQAHQRTFKPRAQAVCVLDFAEREYT